MSVTPRRRGRQAGRLLGLFVANPSVPRASASRTPRLVPALPLTVSAAPLVAQTGIELHRETKSRGLEDHPPGPCSCPRASPAAGRARSLAVAAAAAVPAAL